MAVTKPAHAPDGLFDAFAYIVAVKQPTLDDLKLMVLLEGAGKALYDHMADGVSDPAVKALLHHNGREELAHAHRVSKAIQAITGAPYPVPEPADNPYLAAPMPPMDVNRDALLKLAATEFTGEALYESWATHVDNADAAALLRQNGREETDHGGRLEEAAALLAA